MKKSDKVVFTCITGGYDDLPQHQYVNPECDYILFTDNQEAINSKEVGHWQVKEIPFKELDNIRNSRFPKINAHIAVGEYDYSLYVDGNINITTADIFDKVDKASQANALISIPRHHKRVCIYDESAMVIALEIDNSEVVTREMDYLKSKGYPAKNGLFENCIIYREHNNPKVIATMERWWQMITEFSRRDQLSFCFAAWENQLEIYPLYPSKESHRKDPTVIFTDGTSHVRYKATVTKSSKKYPKFLINFMAIFIVNGDKRRLFRAKYSKH